MRCKTLTTTAILIMMLTTGGCSLLERLVYRPDINQGNYLTLADVKKIYIGMTKQQVAYALSTAMMKDPFGSNTWYYIFRREPSHASLMQQTLILTFNNSDILTHIENTPALIAPSAR
ncbi:outer membrane protein assembly factor BamE [secondary endosymbiont of Ctenarytaina eucalypti]|nr:outer membrane protein assembly factor BamE [secondary endosymbiont of Ctenarytaina eucalypti]